MRRRPPQVLHCLEKWPGSVMSWCFKTHACRNWKKQQHACLHACVHLHMHTHTYTHACTHTHTRMHACMHAHTHTHTHTLHRGQPCQFTLPQWRAEKGWLMVSCTLLPNMLLPCSWCHRRRLPVKKWQHSCPVFFNFEMFDFKKLDH